MQYIFKLNIYFLFLISYTVGSQEKIQMTKQNGVFIIPCKVNGLKSDFIFDTGASSVLISKSFAEELIYYGLIKNDDIIGEKDFLIANGKIIKQTVFNIKSMIIGGITIQNVEGCISNSNTPMLLGQSAISKLSDNISINYNKSQLILDDDNSRVSRSQSLNGNVKEYLINSHKNMLLETMKSINNVGLREAEINNYINSIKQIIEKIKNSDILDINLSDVINSYKSSLPIEIFKAKDIDFTVKINLDIKNFDPKNYRIRIETMGDNFAEVGLALTDDSKKNGYLAAYINSGLNNREDNLIIVRGINILEE